MIGVAVGQFSGSSSGVEHHVANVVVVGSNPISRSSSMIAILGWRLSLERVGCVMAAQAIPARSSPEERPAMSTGEHDTRFDPSASRRRRAGRGRSRAKREARPRRPDHRRRPVQEAPQGHHRPGRDRAPVRGVARDDPARGRRSPASGPAAPPRQLVEKRFRKEVADQVKSHAADGLRSSSSTRTTSSTRSPSRKLDVEAIALPDEGPMTFEMDVEVRPDFPLPAYKALTVKRPVRTISDADVDAQLTLVPRALRPARPQARGRGRDRRLPHRRPDLPHATAQALNEVKEIQFRLQPELRFQDGTRPGPRRGPRRGQAGRDPRGRGQDRLGARPTRASAARRSA